MTRLSFFGMHCDPTPTNLKWVQITSEKVKEESFTTCLGLCYLSLSFSLSLYIIYNLFCLYACLGSLEQDRFTCPHPD